MNSVKAEHAPLGASYPPKFLVYGGQYGSEGKASVTEHLAIRHRDHDSGIVVWGEAGPNSGHTNSRVKTRQIPACSVYADIVMIGPDATINVDVLLDDVRKVAALNPGLRAIYIHEQAGLTDPGDCESERDLERTIGSTASGVGPSRHRKFNRRDMDAVIGRRLDVVSRLMEVKPTIETISNTEWPSLIASLQALVWIVEGSQGVMLDTNMGLYPWVTARVTNPMAILARLGLANYFCGFSTLGVFRSYPIRTGGKSGPTMGDELTPDHPEYQEELASVTGRVRRMFTFDTIEFWYSMQQFTPTNVVFTHMDYCGISEDSAMRHWLISNCGERIKQHKVFWSCKAAELRPIIWMKRR